MDNINVNITQPKPNDPVTMSGNVTNKSTKSRTMLIEYRISGVNVKTENKTIGAGKTIAVTANNLMIPPGERDRTLTIRANFDKKDEETNANNNQKSTTITVAEVTNGFDFSADIIKPSATAVVKDGTIDIVGTVSYRYGTPKSNVFVELRLSGTVIKSEYVDFVPGQTHTIKATGIKITMPASKNTRKVAVAVNDAKKGEENDSTNNYKGVDVTITNAPPEPPTEFHGITVWKLDEYGNLLDGASFKIMTLENYYNGSFYGYENRAEGGIFTVTAPEGTHVVKETVVPPGYIGGPDTWVTARANSNIVYGITNYLPDNAVEKMWITDKNGKEPVKCKRGREYTLNVTFKHYGNNIPISVTQDSVVLTDGSYSENKTIGTGTLSSGNNVGYTTKTYKFTVPNYADEDLSFTARINWDNRDEESKPENNEMIYGKPVYQGDIYGEFVTPNSFYRSGTDIIASFMMYNSFEYVVEPDEDKLNLNYKAYYIDNSNTKQYLKTSRDIKEKYVLPSKDENYGFGNNLAYIKISLPKDTYEKSQNKRIYVECTIDKTNTNYEDFEDNNIILGEWYITPKPNSQTPNTQFEKRKPDGFNPPSLNGVVIDTSEYVLENKQSASWSEWVWNSSDKSIELKNYKMSLNNKSEIIADKQSPSRVAVYDGCSGGSIEKKKCAKHGNDVCTVSNKCVHNVIGKHRLPCSHGNTSYHTISTANACGHGYMDAHTVACSHGRTSSHQVTSNCSHGQSSSHYYVIPPNYQTSYYCSGPSKWTCSPSSCSGGTRDSYGCSGNGGECAGGEPSCNDYDDIEKPCKHGSTSACSDKGDFVKWQLKSGYGFELKDDIIQKANFVICGGAVIQKKNCAKHGLDDCSQLTSCSHGNKAPHTAKCTHDISTSHYVGRVVCSHGKTETHSWNTSSPCSHGYGSSHTITCSHGYSSSHTMKVVCQHGYSSSHSLPGGTTYCPGGSGAYTCWSGYTCSGGTSSVSSCSTGKPGTYCSGNVLCSAGGNPTCSDYTDITTACSHGSNSTCDVTTMSDTMVEISDAGEISNGVYTYTQNGNAYFPEFSFNNFNNKYRSLEMINNKTIGFYVNPFAKNDKGIINDRRVHFTPLYYPDSEYGIVTYNFDLWTPSGMLSNISSSNVIEVKGNMYDDWYVGN